MAPAAAITSAQWLNAGSSVLGQMLGGSKAGGPSTAISGGTVDGSNWSVSTGGLNLGNVSPVILAAAALVAVLLFKRAAK